MKDISCCLVLIQFWRPLRKFCFRNESSGLHGTCLK